MTITGEMINMRLDHNFDASHTLSQKLIIVVSNLIVKSLIVGRWYINALCFFTEETSYFTKHAPFTFLLFGLFCQF